MHRYFTLLLLLPVGLFAQFTNVKIGGSKGLSRGVCEPSIAISKLNPNNILVGSIMDRIYISFDGGRSWEEDTLKSTYGVWGDPVVISDYQGNFYYFHLSDPTGKNWKSEEILDRIVCQRSSDGGRSFNNGGYMGLNHPKDQDKEWACADSSGRLYASWTQFDDYGNPDSTMRSNILFATSDDGGENWSGAIAINQFSGGCLDDDHTTEGAVPAVNHLGQVFVAWSLSGKIYLDRSDDGGKSWLEQDVLVAEHPGGWSLEVDGLNRANGMPVLVAQKAKGEYRGELYINWVDDRNGNLDIWFAKSLDQGMSWSEPQRINDDMGEANQFFTWMCVDEITGAIHILFYDRRNAQNTETEVYLASSFDGGASWTNRKISETPFVPDAKIFFGDYLNIDALNGQIRPVWTRYDKDSGLSIWTALISESDLKEQ